MKGAWIIFCLFAPPLLACSQTVTENSPSLPKREASIDLRKADLEGIQKRSGLNRIQSIRLLEYRRKHGPIRSFYELHYLKGFSPSIVERLRSRAYLGTQSKSDSFSIKERLSSIKGRYRIRWGRILQKRKGYRRGNYLGSPNSVLGKVEGSIPGIANFGASLEKDAGEAWSQSFQRDPSGVAAHFKTEPLGPLENLVLGPISARSAGALLVDNGGGFMGGIGPSQGALFNLDSHTGTPDRTSLSGIGGEFKKKGVSGTFLYSRKKWTARIDTLPSGQAIARSIHRNGIHRDPKIADRRGQWTRKDLIAHVGYQKEGWATAASFHKGKASHPPIPAKRIRNEATYGKKEEKGMELHLRKSRGRTRASASLALQANGSHAFSTAFASRPHDDLFLRARFEAAGWGFDPFWSPVARDGRPFIRVQTAADRSIAPGWRLQLNSSVLHRQWPYYQRTGPGTDRSIQIQAVWTGKENGRATFSLEDRRRERDRDGKEHPSVSSEQVHSLSFAFDAEQELIDPLESRIRIRRNMLLNKDEKAGMLFAHDLIGSYLDGKVRAYWRLAFFDAPAYRTRPYAYENDLLYSFSVRSYYRTGIRSYLLLRFELSESLTAEGKIGTWAYRGPSEGRIGSGDAAIPGRFRSRLRLQLRGSF